jgi:hypothetical protein
VLLVDLLEERVAEHAARRVVRATDLLEHHLDLVAHLVRVEAGVQHRVAEHVDAHVELLGGQGGVVDRDVVGGVGVDAAARALHLARDLAEAAPLGALEEHVLVEVGDAALVVALVGGADPGPDLELGHRRQLGGAEQHGEPVGQHLAGDVEPAQGGARVTREPGPRPGR